MDYSIFYLVSFAFSVVTSSSCYEAWSSSPFLAPDTKTVYCVYKWHPIFLIETETSHLLFIGAPVLLLCRFGQVTSSSSASGSLIVIVCSLPIHNDLDFVECISQETVANLFCSEATALAFGLRVFAKNHSTY